MKKLLVGLLLVMTPIIGFAQQTTMNLKPLKGVWKPSDISSVEVRIRGRLSSDPTTTHRIIGRIQMSTFDWVSLLTMRTTILVPATQTWEIKSLSLMVNAAASTGLTSIEVITQTLPVSHIAPAGKTLAIDVDTTTGVLVLGPVDMTPVAPAPTGVVTLRLASVPTGSVIGPLTDGAVLTLSSMPVSWSIEGVPSVSVQKIEFRLDGVLNQTEINPPYATCGDWSPCPAVMAVGAHTIVATPYDTSGKAMTSTTVNYTVK